MNRLRKLRNEKNISLRTMAVELSTTSTSLSRYEQGKREPNIAMLEKLAKYFNVTPQYLVGWSDER